MEENMIQHTVNNDDWEKDWIFQDRRINLFKNDEVFIEFIERIFHPEVRLSEDQWRPYLEEINKILIKDNLKLIASEMISGRSIFKVKTIKSDKLLSTYSEEIKVKFSSDYISSQVYIMMDNIDHNPNIAIGKAKELIESCAKSILEEMDVEYDKNINFTSLLKKVMTELGLSAKEQDKSEESGKIAAKILGNLSGVSQSMAELRNAFGDGHGKSRGFKSLPPRYARLAVGTANTVVYFLWDTYQEKKSTF